jgi:hypothetical protein
LTLEADKRRQPASGGSGLKRRALHAMVAGFLEAAPFPYSLSVFVEEAGAVGGQPGSMSELEVLDALRIDQASTLYQAYLVAKAGNPADTVNSLSDRGVSSLQLMLLWLTEALGAVGSADRQLDNSTQTMGTDRYGLEVRACSLSIYSFSAHSNAGDGAITCLGQILACTLPRTFLWRLMPSSSCGGKTNWHFPHMQARMQALDREHEHKLATQQLNGQQVRTIVLLACVVLELLRTCQAQLHSHSPSGKPASQPLSLCEKIRLVLRVFAWLPLIG